MGDAAGSGESPSDGGDVGVGHAAQSAARTKRRPSRIGASSPRQPASTKTSRGPSAPASAPPAANAASWTPDAVPVSIAATRPRSAAAARPMTIPPSATLSTPLPTPVANAIGISDEDGRRQPHRRETDAEQHARRDEPAGQRGEAPRPYRRAQRPRTCPPRTLRRPGRTTSRSRAAPRGRGTRRRRSPSTRAGRTTPAGRTAGVATRPSERSRSHRAGAVPNVPVAVHPARPQPRRGRRRSRRRPATAPGCRTRRRAHRRAPAPRSPRRSCTSGSVRSRLAAGRREPPTGSNACQVAPFTAWPAPRAATRARMTSVDADAASATHTAAWASPEHTSSMRLSIRSISAADDARQHDDGQQIRDEQRGHRARSGAMPLQVQEERDRGHLVAQQRDRLGESDDPHGRSIRYEGHTSKVVLHSLARQEAGTVQP